MIEETGTKKVCTQGVRSGQRSSSHSLLPVSWLLPLNSPEGTSGGPGATSCPLACHCSAAADCAFRSCLVSPWTPVVIYLISFKVLKHLNLRNFCFSSLRS